MPTVDRFSFPAIRQASQINEQVVNLRLNASPQEPGRKYGLDSWPLEDVGIRLSYGRVYADDCATCDGEFKLTDAIEVQLALMGDLSEDQRQRLLEIAERVSRPSHVDISNSYSHHTRALTSDRYSARPRNDPTFGSQNRFRFVALRYGVNSNH
jgi:hypothetical protein